MKIYKIKYSKQAKKFIEKQSRNRRIRIYNAIKKLPSGDIKRLKEDNLERYRLRVRRL